MGKQKATKQMVQVKSKSRKTKVDTTEASYA